jgi:hypothetical protein
MLYAAAKNDAGMRELLHQVAPGTTLDTPSYSYDLGSHGRTLAIPLTDAAGATTAYLLYGTLTNAGPNGQPSSLPIRMILKADGSLTVADRDRVVQPPSETRDSVEVLHAAFFPDQFVEVKAAAFAQRAGSTKQSKACKAEFKKCLEGLLGPGIMAIVWIIACVACVAMSAATTLGAAVVGCVWPCLGGGAASVSTAVYVVASCTSDYWKCLNPPAAPALTGSTPPSMPGSRSF